MPAPTGSAGHCTGSVQTPVKQEPPKATCRGSPLSRAGMPPRARAGTSAPSAMCATEDGPDQANDEPADGAAGVDLGVISQLLIRVLNGAAGPALKTGGNPGAAAELLVVLQKLQTSPMAGIATTEAKRAAPAPPADGKGAARGKHAVDRVGEKVAAGATHTGADHLYPTRRSTPLAGVDDVPGPGVYAKLALKLLLRRCRARGVTYFPNFSSRCYALKTDLRRDYDVCYQDVVVMMEDKNYSLRVNKVWAKFRTDSSAIARRTLIDGLEIKVDATGYFKIELPVKVKEELYDRYAPYKCLHHTSNTALGCWILENVGQDVPNWSHEPKDRRPFTSEIFYEACVAAYPEWEMEGIMLDYGLANHETEAMCFSGGPVEHEKRMKDAAKLVWKVVKKWLGISQGVWYDEEVGALQWGDYGLYVNSSGFTEFIPNNVDSLVVRDSLWLEA
ncbi:unnamed protein product [Closterium sp. Naga37s-1]|nr:unnamed protein product [Closterium sp. Naga37s-1]